MLAIKEHWNFDIYHDRLYNYATHNLLQIIQTFLQKIEEELWQSYWNLEKAFLSFDWPFFHSTEYVDASYKQ